MLRINPNYDQELYERCDEFVSYIKEENNKLSKRIIHSSQVSQESMGKPLGKLVYMDYVI